jgi:hypothetical protein
MRQLTMTSSRNRAVHGHRTKSRAHDATHFEAVGQQQLAQITATRTAGVKLIPTVTPLATCGTHRGNLKRPLKRRRRRYQTLH